MKLDINEINHQLIKKMVIFSLFLFKRQIGDRVLYEKSVRDFIKKRIIWEIEFYMTPFIIDKQESRQNRLDFILNKKTYDDPNLIVDVRFRTAMKLVELTIDLKEEDKYEKYIYT